jgi:hypothetical protein
MKNFKRNLLKIVVLIALFAPTAFADDGDMGGGGFADSGNTSKFTKVVIAQAGEDGDGDMGGGGKTPEDPGFADSFMSALYDYLDLMM